MSEMELFRSSTPPIPEESGSALMSPSKSPKARVSLATASTKMSSVRSLPSTPVPPNNNSGRSSFSKTTMSITEQIARKARKSTVLDEKNALLILAIPDYDEYKILKPYSCRSLTNTSQFVGGHDFVTRHNPQEVNDFKKQYSRDVGNLNRQRSVVAPPGSALMAAGFAASTSSSLSLDSTPSSPTSPPGNNRNNQVREVWKKVYTATQKHYWVLTDFGVASLIGPEYRMTTRLPVVPPQPSPSASSPPTTPYPCRSPAPRPNTALVAFSTRESVRIGSGVDLDDEKTLAEISRTEMYSPNSRPLSPPRSPWHATRPTLGYVSPSKPDIPLYVDLVQSSSSLSSPRARLRTPASAVLKLEDCSLTSSMASDSPTLQPFAMEIAPPAVALGQLHPGEVYLFPVRIRNVGFKQHRFRVKKVVATCAGFEAGLVEATYDKDTARLAPGLAAIVTIALSFRTPGRASGALHLELEGSGACEVVLSASLLTRNGKVLVARQFVEITRIRLEGLLTAFPKLLSSGQREHTFIDTESVRYVYQPLENFFVLLITNKTSNIVEDLHTIQLLAKLVPDICGQLNEASIRDKQFELVFGFDELLTAGGHSENISVQQVRVNMEMESHEEKLHNMILESKRAAAKDDMKRHTIRIKEEQRERARLERAGLGSMGNQNSFGSAMSSAFGKSPRGYSGGNDSYGSSSGPSSTGGVPTSPSSYNTRPEPPVAAKTSGMKLGGGGSSNTSKSFMDAMAAEDDLKEVPPMSTAVQAVAKPEVAATVSHDPIGAVVEEKITVLLNREGALEQLEVKGSLYVSVNDANSGCCRLKLRTSNANGIAFQTHPKVDKRLFDHESVLGLKDASKPFPSSRVAFLRWSLKTQDESFLPLNITCWPEEEGGGKMNVSVEYSMDRDMVLDNVNIMIPLGSRDAPSVASIDGQYQHNSADGTLLWHQDQVNSSNNTGTLEFSIRGGNLDAFFPIAVSFFSRSVYSDVEVEAVARTDDHSPIQFGFEKLLSTESYQIV